jgi:hypothetical protein
MARKTEISIWGNVQRMEWAHFVSLSEAVVICDGPYVLLRMAVDEVVRPTLAAFNESYSKSRASSQEGEP